MAFPDLGYLVVLLVVTTTVYVVVDPPRHLTWVGALKYVLLSAAEILIIIVVRQLWSLIAPILDERFSTSLAGEMPAAVLARSAVITLVSVLALGTATGAALAARADAIDVGGDASGPPSGGLLSQIAQIFRPRSGIGRLWTRLCGVVLQAERDRSHLWLQRKARLLIRRHGPEAPARLARDYIEAHVLGNEQLTDEARDAIELSLRSLARAAGETPTDRANLVLARIRALPPGYRYLRGRNFTTMTRERRGPHR